MKKLKRQFLLFFLMLSLALGFLLVNSYRQMNIEEEALWEGISEKVYNQMQALISEFLTQEDARSFSEYRYYQTLPAPGLKGPSLSVSPLALSVPEKDPKGLLGYFQIDPDGSFSTPYLPSGKIEKPPSDETKRKERERAIEGITQTLRDEVLREAGEKKEEKKVTGLFTALDLKILSDKDLMVSKVGPFGVVAGSAQNVYPNPLLQKRKAPPAVAKKSELKEQKAEQASPEGEAPAQLARRKVEPSEAQLKTFEAPVFQEEKKMAEKATTREEAMPAPSPAPSAPAAVDEDQAQASSSTSKMDGGGISGFFSKKYASKPKSPPKLIETYRAPGGAPALGGASAPSLLIDPFQARLVSDEYLLFYRKIWVDQKMYLQGFVVEITRFYQWLMEQSFANSDLVDFSVARLMLGGTAVAQFEDKSFSSEPKFLLFERALGYPLNLFVWKVYAASLPKLAARFYLNLFTLLLVLLATGGLYFIYRTAAAQVFLSQKRQDFVSAVTHELKTPLTSIRMYSEMLEDGWVKEEEKKQEYYRHISKESGRLSHLIDNVLQMARLEKRTYKLNLKTDCPTADFEQLGFELNKLAGERNFHLEISADPHLPPITYDPEALQEVFLIFLDNSLKFSAEHPDKTLRMELRKGENGVIWSWKDRGPGIPSQELQKVFEKFYRVENELTRNTKGTGIGLAMAKMIVESMGAKIEARNREGGGLEIRILFSAG